MTDNKFDNLSHFYNILCYGRTIFHIQYIFFLNKLMNCFFRICYINLDKVHIRGSYFPIENRRFGTRNLFVVDVDA